MASLVRAMGKQLEKYGDWKDKSKRRKVTIENQSNYLSLREVLGDSGNQIKHEKIVLSFQRGKYNLIRLEIPPVRGYDFYGNNVKWWP